MQSFKKLLESVRSVNPDLITEEAANEMLAQYDAGIDQIKNDAMAEGQALGWKEGYDEGKAVAAQEAQKSLQELTDKLDEEATEKLKTVLDMLNEEHAAKLQEVYDLLTSSMVPKSEVEAMDEDYANKLQTAVTAIDNDHAQKFQTAINAVKENDQLKFESREKFHNKKLKAYKLIAEEKLETAQKALKKEKAKKLDILSEQVEKYLNYALQKAIPTKQIISEQKYHAAQKAIEKITSILKINNIIQESKDGIFTDYENKIKSEKETSNKLIAENAELKMQLKKQEAKLLLESKLQKCVPAEASFLRNYFKNATSAKVIEEQIEDAKAVFKRLHDEKRRELVSKQSKQVSNTVSKIVSESKKTVTKVEPVKQAVVTENKKAEEKTDVVDLYAEMLKRN